MLVTNDVSDSITEELYDINLRTVSPSVSVILPVYNAEETLPQAIESILKQTETSLELIIVDDGSTDRSRQIVHRFAKMDSRVLPLFVPHRGIAGALNLGLEQASSPYIARMDADDISLPERLEKQRGYLEAHPRTGLVSCLVKHIHTGSNQSGYKRYVDWINTLTNHDAIRRSRFIESPLAHPSVMFRKRLLDRFGGYRDGPFPEDYDLWLRWLQKGVRMEKIPKLLFEWRDEETRLSRSHDDYSLDAFYTLKARYLARWLESNNPHHPKVRIWGASRTCRRRAEKLVEHGIEITHYVDVDRRKTGNIVQERPVVAPDELPGPESCFIVSYVSLWGVNKRIREHLEKLGFSEEEHFIFAA